LGNQRFFIGGYMTQEPSSMISMLLGVVTGFVLGFIGNIIRDKIIKRETHSELMRGLLTEVSSNHAKCNMILNGGVTGYLETPCWDRIRYSDVLYYRILAKDEKVYDSLFSVYTGMSGTNLGIARYLTALDSDTRVATPQSGAIIGVTVDTLKKSVTLLLPAISKLETDFRNFLIRQKYISA